MSTEVEKTLYKEISLLPDDKLRLLTLVCLDSVVTLKHPHLSKVSKISQIELLVIRCQEWLEANKENNHA